MRKVIQAKSRKWKLKSEREGENQDAEAEVA